MTFLGLFWRFSEDFLRIVLRNFWRLLRTVWQLFEDFPRHFLGLSEDWPFLGLSVDFRRIFSEILDYILRTLQGLSETFRGLYEDFLRTFWRLSEDFLRTFWGLFENFLRIFWGLSQDLTKTSLGLSDDLLSTFWGLSNDLLRTVLKIFWRLS